MSTDSAHRNSDTSSIVDLETSEADSLLPNLLDNRVSLADIDAFNRRQRALNRHDAIFAVYPQQHEEDLIEKRQPATLPREHFGHRLLVKCLQLK